jgi:hypothetical protein
VVRGRGIGKGLPVLKFFVLVEKFDGNMTVCFLKYCRAALVQGLNLVDDYIAQSVACSIINTSGFAQRRAQRHRKAATLREDLPKAAQNTRRLTSISSSVKCLRLLREVTST